MKGKVKYIILLCLVAVLSVQTSIVAYAQDSEESEQLSLDDVKLDEGEQEETTVEEESYKGEDIESEVYGSELIEENERLSREETEELRMQQYLEGMDPKSMSMERTLTRSYNTKWTGVKGDRRFYNGYGELFGNGPSQKIIDVSEWQGVINWDAVAASGEIDGVILRMGYGEVALDKQFDNNVAALNRLGIPYGIYLYSYAYDVNTANQEANFVKSVLGRADVRPTLPVYYDIEYWPNGGFWEWGTWYAVPSSTAQYVSIITTFINSLRAAGYEDTYVYSYRSYVTGVLNDNRILKDTAWIAEYGPKLNYNNTQYNGFTGWQYSSDEGVTGIAGRVDMSSFYGDLNPEPTGVGVKYRGHNKFIGWGPFKYNGGVAGANDGSAKHLEAIEISLLGISNYTISSKVHVAMEGWKEYPNATGIPLGTTGKNRAIESVSFQLHGVDNYKLQYRVYLRNIGWMHWTDEGNNAGTIGSATPIDNIQFRLVAKDGKSEKPSLRYQGHVRLDGWQYAQEEAVTVGTEGRGLRLEALKLALTNVSDSAKISGNVHIQNVGWVYYDDMSNAKIVGTTGKALRLEALNMNLVNVPGYKIQYRVHVQNIGWMDWVDQGADAGTTGRALRIEAIQVRLVKE